MDFNTWWNTYKPVKNDLRAHPNGPYIGTGDGNDGGRMYEPVGAELERVLQVANTEPGRVWTVANSDEGQTIASGYHLVNRDGYFITEVPFEGDFLEVSLNDDDEELYVVGMNGENAFPGHAFASDRDANVAILFKAIQARHAGDEVELQRPVSKHRFLGVDEDEIVNLTDGYRELSCTLGEALESLAPLEFPRDDWKYEVENDDTRLGYDEWLLHNIESAWFDQRVEAPARSSPAP